MNSDNRDPDYLYARQFAYDVLRRLLTEEPTAELLVYLRDEGLALFPAEDALPAMQEALDAMLGDLNSRMLKRGTADFEALHWDFTRLFIGPDSPPAAPWESVYVSRDKLLFQESTLSVKTAYQQHGFHLPETEYEAADHIGYELDFLWNLSCRASQALDDDQQLSARVTSPLVVSSEFMQAHLLAFITPFCRALNNHAETVFYRRFSTLLELFVRDDHKKINELITLQ